MKVTNKLEVDNTIGKRKACRYWCNFFRRKKEKNQCCT